MPYKDIEERRACGRKKSIKYYYNNKEEILEKLKVKETCECGATISHRHFNEHKKQINTYNH